MGVGARGGGCIVTWLALIKGNRLHTLYQFNLLAIQVTSI